MARATDCPTWCDNRPTKAPTHDVIEQIEGDVEGKDGEDLVLPPDEQDDQQRDLRQKAKSTER